MGAASGIAAGADGHERVEGVVVDWDGAALDGAAGAARLRPAIESLLRQGVDVAVAGGSAPGAVDALLAVRPPADAGGRLLLCAGGGAEVYEVGADGPRRVAPEPAAPDGAALSGASRGPRHGRAGDPVERALAELWRRGVSTGQVAVVRDPSGERLARLAADQLERRAHGALPVPGDDPRWTLRRDDTDPARRRAVAALMTLGDGRVGVVGGGIGAGGAVPPVLAAGVFRSDGADGPLLEAPGCAGLSGDVAPVERILDMHAGTLMTAAERDGAHMTAFEFCSLARPGTAVLRVDDPAALGACAVSPPVRDGGWLSGRTSGVAWVEVRSPSGSIAAAGIQGPPSQHATDRVVSYATSAAEARRRLASLEGRTFDALLAEHRAAWGRRWDGAAISVDGDADDDRAVRFALFHLMASVADDGEAAVGARGMSGAGYNGHVFWDADVFVLPFLAATHPEAARAMLEYRIRRLPAAQEAARRLGREGARFPWESAASGDDVTPGEGRDRLGNVLRIRTGELEEHIVADVGWAARCYASWSGDHAFLEGPGLPLLIETARYWVSRIEVDHRGRGHIRRVIGPDEYHEDVDDNAYTNVMARWNLRAAARIASLLPGAAALEEQATWRKLAGQLVDGLDAATGVYEQFAGFSALEPLIIRDIAPRRPVVADILLGAERVRGAQVIKQADVLMLHHLVPEEVAPGSLAPNLVRYEPRTAHGSSLSPAVHAALLARAGRGREAIDLLRIALRTDLDDITGATAAGLHLATMGGAWQAIAWGVAGLRAQRTFLRVDPRPLPGWERLEVRLRFRGSAVRATVEPGRVTVDADPPIRVAGPSKAEARLTGHAEFSLTASEAQT